MQKKTLLGQNIFMQEVAATRAFQSPEGTKNLETGFFALENQDELGTDLQLFYKRETNAKNHLKV